MRKKSGFTLVEMLIVVVIIGILAWAILPKLSWVIARSRDTQRIADLRNIGTAVAMYAERHWEYPILDCANNDRYCKLRWNASHLKNKLSQYIKDIPHNPKKNQMVEIHVWYQMHKQTPMTRVSNWRGGYSLTAGEYLYQVMSKNKVLNAAAILVSRMETPDLANYVLAKPTATNREHPWEWGWLDTIRTLGWVWQNASIEEISTLYLCSEINKWAEAKREKKADWSYLCTYTDEDQLYHIHKIE